MPISLAISGANFRLLALPELGNRGILLYRPVPFWLGIDKTDAQ
jgi:hypothetical protein